MVKCLSESEGGDRGFFCNRNFNLRMDCMVLGNDMKVVNEIYVGFINMIKYGVIVVVVIVIFVVGLIVLYR